MMQTRAQELVMKGGCVAGVEAVDSDGNIIKINANKAWSSPQAASARTSSCG